MLTLVSPIGEELDDIVGADAPMEDFVDIGHLRNRDMENGMVVIDTAFFRTVLGLASVLIT